MEKKKYESPLQYFHDQKTGDFNPETGVIHSAVNKDFETAARYKDTVKAAERVGDSSKLEKLISSTIDKLNGLELQDQYASNPMEQKVLSEKVKMAKYLLQEVMTSANDYIDSIKTMGEVKLDPNSEDFRERLKDSDASRKIKHDSLLDSVNIFNRFVRKNFGTMPADLVTKFESDEASAKRPVAHVKRVEWSKNVILPDNIDVKDRRQVRDWAISLTAELDEVSKYF